MSRVSGLGFLYHFQSEFSATSGPVESRLQYAFPEGAFTARSSDCVGVFTSCAGIRRSRLVQRSPPVRHGVGVTAGQAIRWVSENAQDQALYRVERGISR
jgi:hypothetical protein